MSIKESSASLKLCIRNSFATRLGPVWGKSLENDFPLPENEKELTSTSTKGLIRRLNQCAYTLIISKKLKTTTSEELYNEIIDYCEELSHHDDDDTRESAVSKVEELEERVQEMTIHSSIHPHFSLFGDDSNMFTFPSSKGLPVGRLRLKLEITVNHDEPLSEKEQMDPTIYAFFSKHIIPGSRSKYTKPFSAKKDETSILDFDIPCNTNIDGHYAVIRFFMHGSFFPKSENNKDLPYKLLRPFFNGFMYLSDIAPGETYEVPMKDSCLIETDTGLKRDKKTKMTLIVKVLNMELSENTKIRGNHDPQKRIVEIEKMDRLIKIYMKYLIENKGIIDVIEKMHVPRWPCNMYDIRLTAAFFLLDGAENSPPEKLLDFALEINNMTKNEFVSICEKQLNDRSSTRVDPQFIRALIVIWRVMCIFSHMCEYTADVRVNNSELEDTERFIDVFFTLAGDCEDLGKAIIIMFTAWSEYAINDKTDKGIFWMVKVIRLFVCTSMKGSAYSPSAKTRDIIDDDNLICHFWACATPRYIFSKWIGESYKPQYPWEASLFPWTLEGTNDCHPCQMDLSEICEPEKRRLVKEEIESSQRVRQKLEEDYKELRDLGLPGIATVSENTSHPKDFYHIVNEIWAPYEMGKLGKRICTFELSRKGESRYGVYIRDLIYKPNEIVATPLFEYSKEDLDICLHTLDQQWPVVMPMGDVPMTQKEENDEKMSFNSLDRLVKQYPVVDAQKVISESSGYWFPYIRYFVKNIKVITPGIYAQLETILHNKHLGIYGIDYKFYKLGVGMKRSEDARDCAYLIDIRLFFHKNK